MEKKGKKNKRKIIKVIVDIKTAAPLLLANLPLRKIAVVSDTLFSELYLIMRTFSFYFAQLIVKIRPDEKLCFSILVLSPSSN